MSYSEMKMKKRLTAFFLVLMSFGAMVYGQDEDSGHLKFAAGLITGYNRGFGMQTNITMKNLGTDFPFELRFGIGYTMLNPGNSADARRIFVNNATNGTPEKKGRSADFRIDFLVPKSIFGLDHSYIVFGPRFSTFKGDFKYVGGNEEFEVKSHQWGIGGGIENQYTVSQRLHLVMCIGLDFYFPSTLEGHDTAYSTDNDNVNAQNDNQNNDVPFVYKDANKAIKQPAFMPRIMIGVNYDL